MNQWDEGGTKGKTHRFQSLIFFGGGGGGGILSVPFEMSKIDNLGRNNMEQKPPASPPLPPEINDEVARREKRAIFSSLVWGEGRGVV